VQLPVAGTGALIASIAMVTSFIPDVSIKGFVFLFGLSITGVGVVSCFLSGVFYDKLNARLRAAESQERKEKLKEEKNQKRIKASKNTEGLKK
jgi:hypothetical protein